MSAAEHANANAEHLHKALKDENSGVRYAATQNPNYNKIMSK
jgi:HEAT repeat protein